MFNEYITLKKTSNYPFFLKSGYQDVVGEAAHVLCIRLFRGCCQKLWIVSRFTLLRNNIRSIYQGSYAHGKVLGF